MRQIILLAWLAMLMPSVSAGAWAPDGNPVVQLPADQYGIAAIPFGAGGVLVAWEDLRTPGNAVDLYASALTADGDLAPGWPANGLPLCAAPFAQRYLSLVADGEGGAYASWIDYRNDSLAVYLQRVTAAGTIAPGWPANGLFVAEDELASGRRALAPDGAGGVFVTWVHRDGPFEGTLRLTRFDGAGDRVAGWPVDGIVIGPDNGEPAALLADGAGGAFVAWVDPTPESGDRVAMQRVISDGTLDPSWPAAGTTVAEEIGAYGVIVHSDDAGGAIAAWTRVEGCPHLVACNHEVAARVDGSGVPSPEWPSGGLVLGYAGPVAVDGSGGVMSAWSLQQGQPLYPYFRVVATRVGGDGAREPGWDPDGNPACSEPRDQYAPTISGDGTGGAFVSWIDRRSGVLALYQMRLTASGTVADGWPETGSMAAPAAVDPEEQLLVLTGPDEAIGLWVDRRNGSRDVFAERVSPGPPGPPAPLAVDETGAHRFGIVRLGPNPSRGPFWVVLELPDATPAALELIDLAGRVIESRRLEPGGPSQGGVRIGHRVPAPGVYWVRLRQGAQAAVRRIAIAR